jgi:beta-1,4-mannosyl-glycoprotein beta-1,4-N-acetylglucosaminyltransferase
MIYDCFIFFNELDLLEIRLNILNDVVDKFVIVEATKTFSNLGKPLYFKDNKERFKKFESKIIHIIVDDYPPFESAWDYEWHQRNCVTRGLTDCKNDDVILISDLDEIPNPEKIIKYKDFTGIKVFKQNMFYYYLNNLSLKTPYWTGTKMLSYQEFLKNESNSQKVRHLRGRLINAGGWHFSYLGGAEKIAEKIKSFSHQEYNSSEYTDLIKIKERVEKGEDLFSKKNKKIYACIEIDESFPKYIADSAYTKYNHLICKANTTFYDKLVLLKNKIINNMSVYIKNYLLRYHINSINYKK